jgi:hypothetical protein
MAQTLRFLLGFLGIELAGHLPEMLAGMVEIDDLRGVGKVFGDQTPNPLGTIADHHLLFRVTPASFPCFSIHAFAELYCGFDSPGIGGGISITNGEAIRIPSGLREHTSQLDLAGMRGLADDLALSTQRLFLHHGDSGPIHLHIQDGNGLASDDWQIQLQGFLDLGLFALDDIRSCVLRGTLDGLGRHFQASQNFQLLAAVIEGGLLAHQGLHATHARREFRPLDV